MVNQKMLLLIGVVVVIGWITVSALDAATEWDSPIQTIQDSGKRFSCPSPEKAQLTFAVTLPKFGGTESSLSFVGSEWVNEGVSSSFQPFWLTSSDYTSELTITYGEKTKTYYVDIGTVDTGWLGDQTSGNIVFVTDINHWTGECLDDWSFVSGYPIEYTCLLKEDGKTIESESGTLIEV